MVDNGRFRRPLDRPITDQEKSLIRWLLLREEDSAVRFVPQIDTLKVMFECTCGCPTIEFAIESSSDSPRGARPIRDYLAIVDGHHVGVMLFATETELSMLEVCSLAGTDKPFGLPQIERLFPWEQLKDHPLPSQ